MKRMKQIEIRLTDEQIHRTERILGGLRWIWNHYIMANQEFHLSGNKGIISAYTYDAILNSTEFRTLYPWLKHVPSKARVHILKDAERTLRAFIKYQMNPRKYPKVLFPRFKDKWRNQVRSFFFVKNQVKLKSSNILQIPILKNIELKEIGYLSRDDIKYVTSGRIFKDVSGKYFVNLVFEYPNNMKKKYILYDGIGIDLGIKNYAAVYGKDMNLIFPNVNHINRKVFKYERKISRLQSAMRRKADYHRREAGRPYFTREDYSSKTIRKIIDKLHKYYYRLRCIRNDYIKQIVNRLTVKLQPRFITIEDLHIKELCDSIDNKKHRKSIVDAKWYYFRQKLQSKCEELGIELRIANNDYPSSKICSDCGYYYEKFKSSKDFECPKCGNTKNKDLNAAKNLYFLKKQYYSLA